MAHRIQKFALTFTSVFVLASAGSSAAKSTYDSLCDASAGIALDEEHFAVADDELPAIEIFRRGQPKPVGSLPLAQFLETPPGEEADLEGGARVGDRVYWISSHGRDSDAKFHESRLRFFATEIERGNPPKLTPVEHFYDHLLADLSSDTKLLRYDLAAASQLAPEAKGGLSIEGLAATPEGGLLIGFRNPVRNGRALLVPLLNPAELSRGDKARFGEPIDLDLGGRGIRSIERVGEVYWIVAGQFGDKNKRDKDAFALYRWSGKKGDDATRLHDKDTDLEDFSPEAIFAWPDGTLQILSDDGDVRVEGTKDKKCKKLGERDAAKRSFRSFTFTP